MFAACIGANGVFVIIPSSTALLKPYNNVFYWPTLYYNYQTILFRSIRLPIYYPYS